jgi:hypothetical protein
MPADLLPNEAIPELAASVKSAEEFKVLQHIHRVGTIQNSKNLDQKTVSTLQRLGELGLVDRGYFGAVEGTPAIWVANGNGERVLTCLTGIRAGPHFEISSTELAAWLEQQGVDRWWNVDGDPLLAGRLSFPCPADELAAELTKINRPLLVEVKGNDVGAKGQRIGKEKLDEFVGRFADDIRGVPGEEMPAWSADRFLYLSWKDRHYDWFLTEDSRTTAQMKAEAISQATRE